MEITSRVNSLISLVRESPQEQIREDVLQRVVFTLQKMGYDFKQHFSNHQNSIESQTLSYDLHYAVESGLLCSINGNGPVIYSVSDDVQHDEPLTLEARAMARELARNEIDKLDLLSVILYMHFGNEPAQTLREKVLRMKPNLENHYDDALALATSYSLVDNQVSDAVSV